MSFYLLSWGCHLCLFAIFFRYYLKATNYDTFEEKRKNQIINWFLVISGRVSWLILSNNIKLFFVSLMQRPGKGFIYLGRIGQIRHQTRRSKTGRRVNENILRRHRKLSKEVFVTTRVPKKWIIYHLRGRWTIIWQQWTLLNPVWTCMNTLWIFVDPRFRLEINNDKNFLN